ncbi:MAG TPA: redoxin domain-containing protein [Planctomycetota bacterium]|nr:redoxin domain-containing protein [Planctomycetota bacterium]
MRHVMSCGLALFVVCLITSGVVADDETDAYKAICKTASINISSNDRSRAEYERLVGEVATRLIAQCKGYREKYPEGKHTPEVLALLARGQAMLARVTDSKAKMTEAAETAQQVITDYPDSPGAAEATVVVMEGALWNRQYDDVLEQAAKTIEKYPDSTAVPAALYCRALEYDKLHKDEEATATLETIVKDHRKSDYYDRAERWLFYRKLKGTEMNLQFVASDGRRVDFRKLRGKVVLVHFWASWCPYCVDEIPALVTLERELRGDGFCIVGISMNWGKTGTQRFMEKAGMTWPEYHDGKQWKNPIAQKYRVNSIPQTFLIDKQGKIREIGLHGDSLAEAARKLLAED